MQRIRIASLNPVKICERKALDKLRLDLNSSLQEKGVIKQYKF